MTTIPGRLTVDTATGKITGPARIGFSDPFPTPAMTPQGGPPA